jgi:hypothetical protein
MSLNAEQAGLVTRENKEMKKVLAAIIIVFTWAGACRTTKNAQHALKDSTVSQSPGVTLNPVDSVTMLKQQLAETIIAPLDFTTFYGRAKANFNSPKASGNATVYIKMKRDSIIWVSVTGPLNIEGARVLITPDSVKIINKLEGFAQLSSIAHLQQITKLPFSFNDLQNLILGRPVLNTTDSMGYEIKKDSITITTANDLLTYINSFTKNNLRLGQSNFQALNNSSVTGANVFYNNYQTAGNTSFPVSRDIAVEGTTPSTLQLSFKEYNFNQPLDFVFTISKNYKIKYE